MRRIENWPILFSRFLRERADVPFAYGVNDCMLFTADAVKLVTAGYDPAAEYRDAYSTEEGAQQILDINGGIQSLITRVLQVEPSSQVLTGGRGDVVIMETPYGLMSGVIDDSGARIAVPISNQLTLVRFPLKKAVCVWRY